MLRLLQNPYLLLSLAIFFWAGNSTIGRAFGADISPLNLAFWRWTVVLVLLTPFGIKPFIMSWSVIRKNIWVLLALSFLSVSCFNTLLYIGLRFTTVVNATLVQASLPVIVVALSWVFLKKTITPRQGTGIVASFCGVAMIITAGDLSAITSINLNPGDLIILGAIALWGAYSVMLVKRPAEMSGFVFLYTTVVFGWLFLIPLYGFELVHHGGFELTQSTFSAVAYVALFPSIASYLCWNKGVAEVGANQAGMFVNLMPVFGAILGMVFLGEVLKWYHFAGICLIFAGVWLATRAKTK